LNRKCTLKDGVLTVNGKEYIFHKATGEYEW
jgi:transcription initiation factor TFIIA large subunit